MGGGQEDPEAGGGGKAMGHATSGPLPPSEPPHLRGQDPGQYQYGTFHPPPVGYPQPAPPPGFGGAYQQQPQQPYAHAEPYHAQGYQAVPGSGKIPSRGRSVRVVWTLVTDYGPVVEGRPMRMRRLPCCGLGMGWLLFIAGFFLAAIPWYIGAFILICVRVHDYREKPGYVACTIAAVIAAIVIPLGLAKGAADW